jgi:hypothetical protein
MVSAPADSQVLDRAVVAVDASTPGVADLLQQIAELVVGAGAYLDPRLVMLEREGHVTLATTEGPADTPFISLPRTTLIPVDGLVWDDTALDVTLLNGIDTLTPLQRDLLELHVSMWNATGKRPEFLGSHPKAAAVDDPGLLDVVRAVRPSFVADGSTSALLRTRTFALRRTESTPGEASPTISVVMPILELADHHPDGAPYRFEDDRLGANFQWCDESPLTYVRYGPMRDSIDLACQYGFVTGAPTFFVSAPLTLDLDGHGALHIQRALNRRQAPVWTNDESGLWVTYLPLDVEVGLFDGLFSPVRAYLDKCGVGRSLSRSLAMRACTTVLQLNADLVETIHTSASQSHHGGGRLLAEAAAEQWRVITEVEARA